MYVESTIYHKEFYNIIEILLEKRKTKRIWALNIATGILIPTLNVKSKGHFPVQPYRSERSVFHCLVNTQAELIIYGHACDGAERNIKS